MHSWTRRAWVAPALAVTIAWGILAVSERAEPGHPDRAARPVRARRTPPWSMPRLVWGAPRALVATAHDDGVGPGDGGVGPGDGGEPVVDEYVEPPLGPLALAIVAQVCEPSAAATCAARSACGCGPELPGEDIASREECIEAQRAACVAWVRCRWMWTEVDAESGVVDPSAARACAQSVADASSSCGPVMRGDVCERLIVEDARVGDACEWGGPCVGGSCIDATCQRLPRVGEECADWQCADGATCEEGLCARPAGRGARCSSDAGCALELACLGERCRPRRREGGVCEMGSQCATDLRCGAGGLCERADTCDLQHGCGDTRVCFGEQGARCTRQPREWAEPPPSLGTAGLGEACDGASGCSAGLGCAWSMEAGASEGAYAEASEGAYRCRPVVGEDADCAHAPCDAGLICLYGVIEGVCRPAICDPLSVFGCGE